MKFKPSKLNVDDILTKTFTRKVLGGFSSSEVTDFLQSVAGEIEEQAKQRASLLDRLREKEASLREYREREEVLRDTIISAQKTADRIKQSAEKEARFIVEDAKQKADIIVQDARDSLKTAYQDLSDLKRIHIQLKNTLKSVLQSHQDLLDQDPIHSLLPESFHSKGNSSLIEKKVSESLNKAVRSRGREAFQNPAIRSRGGKEAFQDTAIRSRGGKEAFQDTAIRSRGGKEAFQAVAMESALMKKKVNDSLNKAVQSKESL